MQAIRDSANNDSDKEEEIRGKPQRPPNRRKKSKEPLVEEDIIDGFAILGFKSYEDLEVSASCRRCCFVLRGAARPGGPLSYKGRRYSGCLGLFCRGTVVRSKRIAVEKPENVVHF